MGNPGGLGKVDEIYQNRSQRIQELKADGKKILGYTSNSAPLEILTALDVVPYRISGDMDEPISEADRALPVSFCPFIRSCFDLACKGRYDILDGIVGVHFCDAQEKATHAWKSTQSDMFFPYIDVPHTTHEWSREYFKSLLIAFKKRIESFCGIELTDERLKNAIELYNDQRSLMRELYDLSKFHPPHISGTELFKIMVSLRSIPVGEGNALLKEVILEINERKQRPSAKPARVLVWGDCIDSASLIEVIEEYANLVMDDICIGRQNYFLDMKVADDPFDGFVDQYLVQLQCPRTFKEVVVGETKKDNISNLERRFGYLNDYIEQWNVDGVILLLVRFCDPHSFEVPAIQSYLSHIGIPHTFIEHDYSGAAKAAIKTRIQAFIEMII